MVDMAHFAGLVAAGLHPNPVPYADVVTTTIHKTIGGGRGGMILCREELGQEDQLGRVPRPAGRAARARDRRQGGGAADRAVRAVPRAPGADARRREGGRRRAARRRRRRQRADRRHRRAPGPVRPARVRARRPAGRGSAALGRDHGQPQRGAVRPAPAGGLSGLRIGTPALATRGLQVEDFVEVGKIIGEALSPEDFEGRGPSWRRGAAAIAERYPLYAALAAAAVV